MRKAIAILLAGCPVSAMAFFDHFEGTSLGSHWGFYSEGSNWEHTVSGSILSVNRLFGPFDVDEVGIYSLVEGYGDFTATARVGWSTGAHQTLRFGVSEEFPFMNPRIAVMTYSVSPGNSPSVSAFFDGGGGGSVTAPAPGMHDFTITRVGTQIKAFLNGSEIASTNAGATNTAKRVFLSFHGPDSPDYGNLRVDYVQVVPEPATALLLGPGLIFLARRRRK